MGFYPIQYYAKVDDYFYLRCNIYFPLAKKTIKFKICFLPLKDV